MELALSNSLVRPAAAPYNDDLRAQVIAALFGAGQQGGLYDPSDLSTLFQDSAGTTPVTADGQPVRLIRDLSGNDNHLTAPSDAARPTYRTDGTLHWLDFDGVTQHMTNSAVVLGGDYLIMEAVSDVSVGFTSPIGTGGSDVGLMYPRNRTRAEGANWSAALLTVTDYMGAADAYTIVAGGGNIEVFEGVTSRGTVGWTASRNFASTFVRNPVGLVGITSGKFYGRVVSVGAPLVAARDLAIAWGRSKAVAA